MENKTRDVETCQMVAISKDQILKIRGGISCGNSYHDDVTVSDNGSG
jgi:hypothetical protein